MSKLFCLLCSSTVAMRAGVEKGWQFSTGATPGAHCLCHSSSPCHHTHGQRRAGAYTAEHWPATQVCVFRLLGVHRAYTTLPKLFVFFFFFAFSRATPTAYGGSQARGLIGGVAASLHQSHGNMGSKLRLQPTPQPTAKLDP